MEFKIFIAGCLGGFAGIVTSYPLDTIKVRIQNQNSSNVQYRGAIDCLKKTLKQESIKGLYKGMSSPLIGSMFVNAVLFGVEENARKMFDQSDCNITNSENYKLYALSGAFAGLIQSALISPVELVKIKMQISRSNNANIWKCAMDILKPDQNSNEKGHNYSKLRYDKMMRGAWLTCLRDVPAMSCYFVCFEYMCNLFKSSTPNANKDNLPIKYLFLAGGTAGCLSWLVTYPIDFVKTRYQADVSYRNVTSCFRVALKTHGFHGLWSGLTPTLLRAFPNNAAIFATIALFNRFTSNEFDFLPNCSINDEQDFYSYKFENFI